MRKDVLHLSTPATVPSSLHWCIKQGRTETAHLQSEAAALEQRLAGGLCINLATTAADAAKARDALASAEAAAASRVAEAEVLSSRLAAADAREAARQEELAPTEAQLVDARERLAAAEAARADVGARSLLQAQTALLEAEGRLSEQAFEIVRLQQRLAVANADAGT